MAAHGICLLLRCEGSEGITRPGCSCPLPQDPMSAAPGEHLTLPQLPTAQPSLATGPAERGYLQADSLAKPQPGPTGDAWCPGLGCPSAPPSALLPTGVVRQAWLWGPALLLLGEPQLLPTSQPQGTTSPCCTMTWTMRKDLSKKILKKCNKRPRKLTGFFNIDWTTTWTLSAHHSKFSSCSPRIKTH